MVGAGIADASDVFSYSLAMERRDQLLFKGGDFPRTDVAAAVRSSDS